RNVGVPQNQMRKILEVITDPRFNAEEAAKTFEELKQEERKAFPFPGQYQIVVTNDKGEDELRNVFFFDLLEVLELVLSDLGLFDKCTFHYVEPPNGIISHP